MKRVLIVAYYIPPLGGPGIQRVIKFAKYLPRFGWEPLILGVKPIAYHSYDETILKEIKGLRIVRTESLDPTRILAKIFGKSPKVARAAHRGRLDRLTRWFIPFDSRLPWVPYAVREGKKLLQTFRPDLIFSSSPPMSGHLVALKLKQISKKPWIADFRDPFVDIFPPPTPLHRYIQRRLIDPIKREADVFVAVSKKIEEKLQLERAVVIENGFDPEDMEVKAKERDDRLVIVYAGGLLMREYSFFPLLDALKEIEGVVLKLAGFLPPTVVDRVNEAVEMGKVEYLGYLPHKEAIALMKSADILWLTVHWNLAKDTVPIQLFEYIGTRKPILATAPEDSLTAHYIKKYNLGVVVSHSKEEIKRGILSLKKNPTNPSPEAWHYFNKVNQTERLAEIFNELVRRA